MRAGRPAYYKTEEVPMLEMPLITAVFLSFNRRAELEKGLSILYQDPYPALEVIVVDNGSTDGTRGMVKRQFSRALLLTPGENTGVGGWNFGFQAGRGEFFFTLDDDSAPRPGCLHRMVEKFMDNPRLGVAACNILNLDDSSENERLLGMPSQTPPEGVEHYFFIGCGAGIRAGALRKTSRNGFEPAYFLYHHESPFALEIIDRGYEVRYFSDLPVRHSVAPAPFSMRHALKMKFATRNIIWYYRTYFPPPQAGERIAFLKARNRKIAEKEDLLEAYAEGVEAGEGILPGQRREISGRTLERLRSMGWPGRPADSSMGLDKQF